MDSKSDEYIDKVINRLWILLTLLAIVFPAKLIFPDIVLLPFSSFFIFFSKVLLVIILFVFSVKISRFKSSRIAFTYKFTSQYTSREIFEKLNELSSLPLNKKKSTLPDEEIEELEPPMANPTIELFYESKKSSFCIYCGRDKKSKTSGGVYFLKQDQAAKEIYNKLVHEGIIQPKNQGKFK